MDEDEEQFYDSLEEDLKVEQDCDSAIQPLEDDCNSAIRKVEQDCDSAIHSVEQDCQSAFQDAVSILKSETSQYELCDDPPPAKKSPKTKIPVRETKIPLYVGETAVKGDVKILKNKTPQKTPSSTRASKTCIACEKSKLKIAEVKKREIPSSYWDLYCQKNGISKPPETDGLESFYGSGNNKTFRSFINSSSCLSGRTWDAPSVFEKYIPKTYASSPQKNETQSLFLDEKISLNGEYKSVSNMDVSKTPRVKQTKISKCKSNTSNISFRPLSLKCVGPDPEKLEQLRKQQDYGRRVSSRNRARIIQNINKVTDVFKREN